MCLLSISLLSGCVAQQPDLRSTERRFKESNDALAQRGAQQRQEIEELKSQELPKLRGELERAQHQIQELLRAQDDVRQRSAVLEVQMRKLEQLSAKLDGEGTSRNSTVREDLNARDFKAIAARFDLLDEMISKFLVKMEEFDKRLRTLEKR
jgi:hypothetical protein